MRPHSRPTELRPSAPLRAEEIDRLFEAAADRRAPLLALGGDSLRLFHDRSDGIPGLVLERLGDVLIVQCHEERLVIPPDLLRVAVGMLCARLGLRAAYRKDFPRDRSGAAGRLEARHNDPEPWWGVQVEPERIATESVEPGVALRWLVHPYDGYSTGVFLEHRDNRARVRAIAAGRRVLNGFAYTCGYGVAAGVGSAAEVVNVDVSRKYLEWGKRNLGLNGLSLESQMFICDDVQNYYRRAARQGRRFDLAILDPPTFARAPKTGATFSLAAQLDELVRGAVERIDDGGVLLLCCNHRTTGVERLRAAIESAGRPVRRWETPPLPADFPGDPDFARSIWAWFD